MCKRKYSAAKSGIVKGDGSRYCCKPVTGDKNGGTQVFKFGPMPSYYPTEEKAV